MSVFGNRRPRRLAIEAGPSAGTSWMRAASAATGPITPPPPTEPLRRQAPDDRPLWSIAQPQGPSFTPVTGPPTEPTRVLSPGQPVPAAPPHAQQDQALMQKVLDDLRSLDARERVARFKADKEDLAFFKATVRRRGVCGLHAAHRSSHVRWTTERWARQNQALIEAQEARYRAENHAQIDRALAEVHGKRRAA